MAFMRPAPRRFMLALIACACVHPARAMADSVVLDFSVLRDGQPFGHHIICIRREPGRTEVENSARAEVTLGPFRLFTYDYDSHEIWEDGHLLSLAARTDDDGDKTRVTAQAEPDGLRVRGPQGEAVLAAGILPTSFWTIAATRSPTLLDTKTGQLDTVATLFLGQDRVGGESGVPLDHYRMTGDLIADLWYDRAGLLARARFSARGSVFDYVKAPPPPRVVAGVGGARRD
jgi:hypothetical protein